MTQVRTIQNLSNLPCSEKSGGAAEREGDDPGEDDPAQRAVEGHHDVVTVRFADRHVVVHYDEGHGNHGHLGGKAGFHY